jgi:hypothetical protein
LSRGGNYSPAKREREAEKARKKQEKAERRMQKRERGPRDIPIVSADEITGGLPSVEEAMRAMETRATAPRSAATIPARLFVGSLSDDTNGEHLRAAFSEFGPVAEAVVVLHRETRTSRGFGFVTMADRKDAAAAIDALHGSELNGRRIVVNVATERQR